MPGFDVSGAKKAGYSDAEIASEIAKNNKFDYEGAKKSGYSDKEIIEHFEPDSSKGRNLARALATGVGQIGGGIIGGLGGGAITAPVGGEGAIPGAVAGAGLGGAIGGQLYDVAEHYLKGTAPKGVLNTAKTIGSDVLAGGLTEMGGQLAGKYVVEPALKYGANLVAKLPISKQVPTQLARALTSKAVQSSDKMAADAAAEAARNKSIISKNAELMQSMPASVKPNVTTVGEVRETPADIGAPLQQTSVNAQRNLKNQRAQTDLTLRNTQNQIAEQNALSGITVNKLPTYKKITDTLIGWKTNSLGKAPDPGVQKLYAGILERIGPQKVSLSPQEAKQATAQGVKIIKDGNKLYRTFEPSFEGIDNARRFVGEVFSGKAGEGYGAISAIEKQKIYNMLNNVQEEYVGAAHPALQANWREKTQQLADFDTRIGKKLTGVQPGTNVPSQTPEAIANAAFGGRTKGSADFDQLVSALGGDVKVARKSASDYLATALDGKNYDQAVKEVNRIRPMLKNPNLKDLESRADEYLTRLQDAEQSGVKIEGLQKESSNAESMISKMEKREATYDTAARKILTEKDPKKAADMAIQHFEKMSSNRKISPEEYASLKKEYDAIDFQKPEKARKFLLKVAGLLGTAATAFGGATAAMKRINPVSVISNVSADQ